MFQPGEELLWKEVNNYFVHIHEVQIGHYGKGIMLDSTTMTPNNPNMDNHFKINEFHSIHINIISILIR